MSRILFLKNFHTIFTACTLALTAAAAFAQAPASPAVGSDINTSVSAYFQTTQDSPQVVAVSNIASILIQQPAGVTMAPFFSMQIAENGNSVYCPITLKNTGGSTDSYTLELNSSWGWQVSLISDTNSDSIHESNETTPIANPLVLAPGQTASFFIALAPPQWMLRGTVGFAALRAISADNPQTGATAIGMAYSIRTVPYYRRFGGGVSMHPIVR